MTEMRPRNIATNVVMPVELKEKLEALSRATRVSQSDYLREAVNDLLQKYGMVPAVRSK